MVERFAFFCSWKRNMILSHIFLVESRCSKNTLLKVDFTPSRGSAIRVRFPGQASGKYKKEMAVVTFYNMCLKGYGYFFCLISKWS